MGILFLIEDEKRKIHQIEIDHFSDANAAMRLASVQGKQIKNLSPAQEMLISEIIARWKLTAFWVLMGKERNKNYPFNVPRIRKYVKQIKPWFYWEQAFYELLALVFAYSLPSNGKSHPLYIFADYIEESMNADISAIAEGNESRSIRQSKEVGREALRHWELWLEEPRHEEGKPIGNSTLAKVLRGARKLENSRRRDKKHPLIKEYLQAGREWWKFCERNQIIRPFASSGKIISYQNRRHPTELKRLP